MQIYTFPFKGMFNNKYNSLFDDFALPSLELSG